MIANCVSEAATTLSQAQTLAGLKQLIGLQLSRVRGLSFAADQGRSADAPTDWVEYLDEPAVQTAWFS
jgi:hypothetical protein